MCVCVRVCVLHINRTGLIYFASDTVCLYHLKHMSPVPIVGVGKERLKKYGPSGFLNR